MEFQSAVDRRRMVRAFSTRALPRAVVDEVIGNGLGAPSAGNTQGWAFVVLDQPEDVAAYWDVALPESQRDGFRWPLLLDAPVLVVALAEPDAYRARYAEPDKATRSRGAPSDWPVPYWTVDTSFAVMLMLLTAVDRGLGALFFGLFDRTDAVLAHLGVPGHLEAVGVIALGYPEASAPGRSAGRGRRSEADIIHRGGW